MKLSKEAKELVFKWQKDYRIPLQRPNWDEFLIDLAFSIAKRSSDPQTQCGCVITDSQHRILGVGYNGFIREINDLVLPNIRKDNAKYPFMIHAELNAILNCEHKPVGGIAYVTCHPCSHCFQCLYQVGIAEIVYGDHQTHMQDKNEAKLIEEILEYLTQDKMKVRKYNGNL